MRIAYGVFGYGQGHATRSSAVLSELVSRHDVLVLAGGSAYKALVDDYPVVLIPTLRFWYDKSGRRSEFLTFRKNVPSFIDIQLQGPVYAMVEDALREFQPDVVISDAEPWTHKVASDLKIPRISFDHFGVIAHGEAPMSWVDRLKSIVDRFVYGCIVGRPERVLVSSFYTVPTRDPKVRFVGTLLRPEVFQFEPSRGEYLLGYFNNGDHLFSARIERALRGLKRPVVIHGLHRVGRDGNLEFRLRSNRAFLEALAGCRAVVSTAGNQLVGEAIHFNKPMLVLPEDSVEQRVNALAVERLGVGEQVSRRKISTPLIEAFLEREEHYRETMKRLPCDGKAQAVQTLETFIEELTGRRDVAETTSRVA